MYPKCPHGGGGRSKWSTWHWHQTTVTVGAKGEISQTNNLFRITRIHFPKNVAIAQLCNF